MVRFRELYKAEKEPVLLSGRTSTGRSGDQYYFIYETVAEESRPLFIVLRHRAPISPIYLSEEIHKPFALSRVFLLSSGGESAVLAKKKAPSRSGILLSMHVVLETRHVNPNVHARRY